MGLHIGFLTPEYPHPATGTSGGIGTSIKNLASGLADQGYPVSVIVYGQKEDAVFEQDHITIYRVKNVKFKGLSWYLTRKKLERLINKLYAAGKIDLIEAPDWTGITSFIKPKCPVIIRLNGSDTYFCHLDGRSVKWANKFHERRALKNADGLLSVSKYTAQVTNELFGLDREFTVIPNSINVENFTTTNASTPHQNTILYFGTLIRKKGLLELPYIFNEVFRANSEAQLIIVGKDSGDISTGNSSTWEMMQPLFSPEARGNVQYLGSVRYDEIRSHIEDAAVCIFPTFAEALPVSWLEAMSMRKAIVASDIGWAKEVIENGKSGFLAHPTNHTEYAQHITKLLNSSEMRTSIGDQAQLRVIEKFDVRKVMKDNIAFYQKVLNEAI